MIFGGSDLMMLFSSAMELEEMVSGNSVALVIYCIFSFLFSLAIYAIIAGALYMIATRRGVEKPWLAWVPVGQLWLLGAISDHYQFVVRRNKSSNRKTLLWLQVVLVVLLIISLILIFDVLDLSQRIDSGVSNSSALRERAEMKAKGLVVPGLLLLVTAGITVVYEYFALYDLFRSCDPANSRLYLLLSIFVSITMPVFLLMLYDRDDGLPQSRLYKWSKKRI